jgi:hypothetical protein
MQIARRVWSEALHGAYPPTRLQAPPPLYELRRRAPK